ncbi:MAG: C2H2-type zinc finger protein [Haloarculaceae archaeon]
MTTGGDTETEGSDHPPTSIPAGDATEECPYCALDLPDKTQYRLHLGVEHYDQLSDAEREGFHEAYRAEADALDRFRIIALGGLVLLYFGFLLVYALLAA